MLVRASLVAALLVAQQPAHTISVTPLTPRPTETVTVTGSSDCAAVAYTVTLAYRDADQEPATATESGTTDGSGGYTQPLTIPENAYATDPATVTATVACEGGDVASNVVDLAIAEYDGTAAVTPASGVPGTVVTLSGTECWGGRVQAVFGDGDEFDYAVAVTGLTLAQDRTFTGTFTIPDVAPGSYVFAPECPGSAFPFVAFTVLAVGPPLEAPPAAPVPGTPTFTG